MEAKDQILATLEERGAALQTFLTEEIFNDLFKYGIVRLKIKFNIRYDIDRGFRGILLHDIVNDLIESFLKQNGRNWNKTNFPSFKDQFISSFDSTLSNTVDKELEKVVRTESIEPNSCLLNRVNDKAYNKLLDSCMSILKNIGCSDEEILLFEPYYINGMKREDIAEYFGLDINEVTNIKKRLDRKIPRLRNELTKMENGR